MIKKIHYCWFGGKKLPKDVKKCIATWKKMLPDYEIIEWNEEKFDVNSVPFVKQAYDNKKWAFVSDYVRTYALYEQGGLYLDTDVKIFKNVEDIIDKNLVFGYEDSGYFGTAVIATNIKHNPYIKEILEYYSNIEDFNVDIIYNYANPAIITRIINKYPVELQKNGVKIFNKEVTVYPRDYFYPLSYNYSEKVYTKNTCMVHLFNGTWTDKGERRTIGLYRKFGLGLGGTLNKIIDFIFSIKSRIKNIIYGIYKFLRMKYSIYINRNKRVNGVKRCLERINEKYIAICHPDFKEDRDIAFRRFGDNLLELREQYTKKEAKMMAETIVNSNKELVIFNNYAAGWDVIMSEVKKANPKIIIKVIINYGNEYLCDPYYWEISDQLLTLYFKGTIDEFGFTNKETYEFYKERGYNAKLILNDVNIELNKEKVTSHEGIKVGLYFNEDNIQNNIYNQLSAVSLLDNAKIDCIPLNYRISGIAKKFDINLSGSSNMLSKEYMLKKMSENDINLYIINTDFSNLLPLESMEVGTLCLVSENICLFDNEELKKYLVVKNTSDILEIKEKIIEAIKNKEKILELYTKWKIQYSKEALESIKEFLKV